MTGLGIAVISLIAAVCLGELAARLLIPSWAPARTEHESFWQYDTLLGWSQPPGSSGIFHGNGFTVDIRINRDGLRDTEYTISRTPGKRRMLILGDSYAWGYGVQRPETFHEILEARHIGWEFINTAVSGYSTDQEYLYYSRRGYKFFPDVVLLLLIGNDFSGNETAGDNWYSKPYCTTADDSVVVANVPVPPSTLYQRLNRFIVGHTWFVSRMYLGGLKLYRALQQGQHAGADQIHLTRTGAIVNTLVRCCRTHGSSVVIAMYGGSETETDYIRRKSDSLSVPFCPLDPVFAGHPELLLPHDEHWNAAGHRAAAGRLESFLDSAGIFTISSGQR